VRNPEAGVGAVLDAQLKVWSEQRLLDHEDARLEQKHPDFRLLMEEYHDGILLFELTDQLVMAAPISGLPAAVAVAIPIALLTPVAVARISWLPS